MSKYTYCVITKVPDNSKEGGNLATAMFATDKYPDSDLYLVNDSYHWRDGKEIEADRTPHAITYDDMQKVLKGKSNSMSLDFRVQVFELGELLILDAPDGREVAGKQRAPRKWYVEYEEFDDIEDAIKRSREVLDAEFEEWKAKNLHE